MNGFSPLFRVAIYQALFWLLLCWVVFIIGTAHGLGHVLWLMSRRPRRLSGGPDRGNPLVRPRPERFPDRVRWAHGTTGDGHGQQLRMAGEIHIYDHVCFSLEQVSQGRVLGVLGYFFLRPSLT